jgi:hypothetical protein
MMLSKSRRPRDDGGAAAGTRVVAFVATHTGRRPRSKGGQGGDASKAYSAGPRPSILPDRAAAL